MSAPLPKAPYWALEALTAVMHPTPAGRCSVAVMANAIVKQDQRYRLLGGRWRSLYFGSVSAIPTFHHRP